MSAHLAEIGYISINVFFCYEFFYVKLMPPYPLDLKAKENIVKMQNRKIRCPWKAFITVLGCPYNALCFCFPHCSESKTLNRHYRFKKYVFSSNVEISLRDLHPHHSQLVLSKRAEENKFLPYAITGSETLGSILRVQSCSDEATELTKCSIQWYRLSSECSRREPILGSNLS